MTVEERLAGLVIEKWGADNGVKYLSSVITTLTTASQMQVLIKQMEDQLDYRQDKRQGERNESWVKKKRQGLRSKS